MVPLAQLLKPFLLQPLLLEQQNQIELYLELLLKWNEKMNLTAIRHPQEIVQRHFGESIFTAERLQATAASTLLDVGSGAGFPGLPIKIFAPMLTVTLIEAQQKKATFLREVIRRLKLQNTTVYAGRAQEFQRRAQIVTVRAVEKFESVLPTAASLVEPGGRLAMLLGASQIQTAQQLLGAWNWELIAAVPESQQRVLLIGHPS